MCYSLFFSFLWPVLFLATSFLSCPLHHQLCLTKSAANYRPSEAVHLLTWIHTQMVLPYHSIQTVRCPILYMKQHYQQKQAWKPRHYSNEYASSSPRTENTQKLLVYLFLAGDFPASSWTDPRRADNVVAEESGWIKLQGKEHGRDVWDICDIQHIRTTLIKVQLIVMLPLPHTHDC